MLPPPFIEVARVVVRHGYRLTRQRIADYLRERRIRALRLAVDRAYRDHDRERMQAIARDLFAECDRRSPRQIARMERAALDSLDPHARAVAERSVGDV